MEALSPSIVETTAGFTAGVVATLVGHPFDVVKTRLQIDNATRSRWGNSFRIFRNIIRDEGSVSALYRGLTPNVIGNAVSWGLYFLWYGKLKDAIQSYRGPHGRLNSLDYFVASGTSGILTAICTNPIWVLKTRMLSTGRNAPGAYRSALHGVREIIQADGFLGFYRGLIPSLFGVGHGAVQFVAYEQLKNHRMKGPEGNARQLSNWDYLASSALSKAFAGSITYPYQVVRARLQAYNAERSYRSATDVLVQILRHEGLTGFYKGLVPNLVRVLPSTCVTFLVYENVKYHLPGMYKKGQA